MHSEPLEGIDSLDVLLFYFFYLCYIFVISCSRSTCRHVDLFKTMPLDLGVQAFGLLPGFIYVSSVGFRISALMHSEPLEGPDTLDVLLDLNDSVHIRTYPLSWISAPIRSSLCYILSRFLFKIDMLTCRSVQDAANRSSCSLERFLFRLRS